MTPSSTLQPHTDDERRLRRRRVNNALSVLPNLVAIPAGLAAAHADGRLAFAVVASVGTALLLVGIAKGLGHRAFPPQVAALVGGSVPAMVFEMLWLLLHHPWAALAVPVALAGLIAATRTPRSNTGR